MSIRRACSLVPVRADGTVHLVRRADQLRFFGGFWAFPGGGVDPADADATDLAPDLPESDRDWIVAGVRESLEELGLEVYTPGVADPDELRRAILEDPARFGPALRAAGARIDTARLRPWLRLLTPDFLPIRFDTVFHRVDVDEDQPLSIWPGELVDGAWDRPEGWLRRWRAGELLIAPPVVMMLEVLATHGVERADAPLAELETEFGEGELHPIYFNPAVRLLPLRTPTLPPATHTNAYAIGSDPAWIVDPASPHPEEQGRLLRAIRRMEAAGRRFAGILLTHHHPDHVGGVEALRAATGWPVHAHAVTRELLAGQVTVDHLLEDGQRLPLGQAPDGSPDWEMEVVFTPGHAAGHVCFLERRYGSLLAGDMVSTLSSILVHPEDGDMAVYLASLERLCDLPVRMVFPAHGPASEKGVGTLRHQLEHRRKRQAAIEAAVAAGPVSIAGIVTSVYGDLPESMRPYAALSVESVLLMLASQGRVGTRDGEWVLA